MTKVLIFESDREFAQILSLGLRGYGCEVSLVEDGEEGIEAASNNKPDLILLTIELPRMNGFSVCNKLKRNADLKSVPLALLSSEATEETFEQHKRLRTRADAYVHKPITVDDLVTQLSGLLTLTKLPASEMSDEDVMIEDVAVDDDITLEEPGAESLDAEADEAFGNLMMEDKAPEQTQSHPEDEIEMEELELEDDGHLLVASAEMAELPAVRQGASVDAASIQKVEELETTISALKSELSDLQSALNSARAAAESEADAKSQVAKKKDAEIELIQKELEALRAKLESNESSGTAREFLDLREKLNKKDKEILDVRDELTSKEKSLVRTNDEAIALGREKADLLDQVSALLSAKTELEKQNYSLGQDKEQAQKRGDDFKLKSERLQSELETRTTELRALIESHENAIATKEAQEAALRVDHQEALAQAAAAAEQVKVQAVAQAIAEAEEKAAGELESALVSAAEAAKREREAAVSARAVELKAEHDGKMAALHRANEESMRKLRAEHVYDKEQEQNAAAERLAARERELYAERDAALAELAAQKAAAEQERDQRISELESLLATRTLERDADRTTILQREGTIAQLEASAAALRAELSDVTEQLSGESHLLTLAREKWQQDSGSIQSARDTLTQALALLEQAQQRPMP